MSRVHRIAVFISHIYGDYQRDVCQGIIDKATEYGYHVDIFASNDEVVLGKYSTGEFSILKIPNKEIYDGALVSSGTYLVSELGRKIVDELKTWNCPVIDINSIETPFPQVRLDNNEAIVDIIKHLAMEHHFDRICYLGNSVEEYISNIRLNFYKKAMIELDFKDKILFTESDYSDEGIRDALDKLLIYDPQAIVCYNDRMAYTVMSEMASKGINIPKRVAVTGVDNLEYGQNISPALTTITFPAYEMGEEAFMYLLEKLDDIKSDRTPMVKAIPKFGNSCGCNNAESIPPILFSNKQRKHIEALERICLTNMRMSSSLQGLTDIDEGVEVLSKFLGNIQKEQGIEGLRECYMCLYSGWDRISSQVKRLTQTEEELDNDKIVLKLAIKDNVRLPECIFSRTDALPEFIRKNGSSVYVFTPLFFGEKSYGYLCQAYEKNRISYPFPFVTWLQNVNAMLQSVRNNRNMQLMLNRLEDIYSHDSLTGLLNLQRFTMNIPGFLDRARERGLLVTALVLDLDHLKKINDEFGHAEGNFAIQVLGQAISQVLSDDLQACRFGGDEFYMMAAGLSEEESLNVIRRIQKYLENYNNTSGQPFKVSVSGGYAICETYDEEDFNDTFKKADKSMYLNKRLKREQTINDKI